MAVKGYDNLEWLEDAYASVRDAANRAKAYREITLEEEERTELLEYADAHPELSACAGLTESVVGTLSVRNYSDREFYERLATFVFESELLAGDGEDERVLAFGLSLMDRRLPYRHYDVVTMTEDRFLRLSNEWVDEVEAARRIACRPFLQKTQEASAVLELISSVDDNARCVVLAHFIDEVREGGSAGRQ